MSQERQVNYVNKANTKRIVKLHKVKQKNTHNPPVISVLPSVILLSALFTWVSDLIILLS